MTPAVSSTQTGFATLSKRINESRWMTWLFRPHPSLQDELSQRRSLMLGWMLFFTVLFGVAGLIISLIQYQESVTATDNAIIAIGAIILTVTFFINRQGQVNISAGIFILITSFVFVIVPYLPNASGKLAYFSIVPIMLTSIYFSSRATVAITIALVVIIGFLAVNAESVDFLPIYFLLIAGTVNYLFVKHLQYQEGLRNKALEHINAQLKASEESLEIRVQERTRDLQLAADVSLDITTKLDKAQLLVDVTQRMTDNFGLYHVAIFLYDEQDNLLKLNHGAENAKPMMREQYRLNEGGIIPDAALTRQPALVNDIHILANYIPNPHLPKTRSELAIPMVYGGKLIGVLDIQSEQVNRFRDEDVRILRTLADQIAVALRNAQLFNETTIAKEEAERADLVKSAFLASMSHELRTPLNAIINFSKFLKKGIPGPVNEEQTQLIGNIAESGQHLLNLINDVLDMSKIEAGSLRLYVEPNLNVRDLLQSAIQYAHPLLADKAVTLIEEIPATLPELTGDRKRLLQVFLNILSNACKFTHEGTITVRAERQSDNLLISVQDTGTGIAHQDADHVFTAFKQTESGLRQGGGGTGLGMPISQKLVEAHEGRIWFTSEVGTGTTFYVELPLQSSLQPERSLQRA